MKIIVVDTELDQLTDLTRYLREIVPVAEISSFQDPLLAMQYAMNHVVDCAFVSTMVRRANVYELSASLRRFCPRILLYVTGEGDAPSWALEPIGAAGYIRRPLSMEILRDTLHLRVEGLA